MTSAFISYSRFNAPFANRLYLDLKRAGVDAWLDTDDIPSDSRWRPKIEKAICDASDFLLLASPESAKVSTEVHKELTKAQDENKSIHLLRVGGAISDLPDDWQARQIIDSRDGYASQLAKVLGALNRATPAPPLLADLLNRRQGTVADAAEILTGALSWTVAGRQYHALPVEPSGYTMTWLVAPADAPLAPPPRLAVLLKFTGPAERGETAVDVIQFLSDIGVTDIWLVYVRGPKNEASHYDLPVKLPDNREPEPSTPTFYTPTHIWDDSARASARAMQLPFVKAKELHLFLESPTALIFSVAAQLLQMGRHLIYQYDRHADGCDRYRQVLGPKPI